MTKFDYHLSNYETPIAIWQARRIIQATWGCLARYHATALDAVTKARPTFVAPEVHHTSEVKI